jgi:16S rRNA C1402 (ribose-2'-O) methylase RsmI
MTKMHEELIHGTIGEILATLVARDMVRGEITVVFAAAERKAEEVPPTATLREELERLRAGGMRRNDAIKALSEKYGMSRNDLYRLLTAE